MVRRTMVQKLLIVVRCQVLFFFILPIVPTSPVFHFLLAKSSLAPDDSFARPKYLHTKKRQTREVNTHEKRKRKSKRVSGEVNDSDILVERNDVVQGRLTQQGAR